MSEALERAKRCLQFEDIYQSRVEAWLVDGFDPLFDAGKGYRLQFKHHVTKAAIIELKENGADLAVFRVYIDVGVRLLRKSVAKSKKDSALVAQIEASYCVDYRLKDKKLKDDAEALDEFALKNASYHLWPYWREFAMSQALRMNLPKIALPVRMVNNSLQPSVQNDAEIPASTPSPKSPGTMPPKQG